MVRCGRSWSGPSSITVTVLAPNKRIGFGQWNSRQGAVSSMKITARGKVQRIWLFEVRLIFFTIILLNYFPVHGANRWIDVRRASAGAGYCKEESSTTTEAGALQPMTVSYSPDKAVRAAVPKRHPRLCLQGWVTESRSWLRSALFGLIALPCCVWRAQDLLDRTEEDATKPISDRTLQSPTELPITHEQIKMGMAFGQSQVSNWRKRWGSNSSFCVTSVGNTTRSFVTQRTLLDGDVPSSKLSVQEVRGRWE